MDYYDDGVFEGAGTLDLLAIAATGVRLQKGFKMTRDEFVIGDANDTTILVRYLLAGVRFLFVTKRRRFNGVDANEPKPSELSLRNQARTFALHEAPREARVEKGKSGGGLCYSYDVVKHTDAQGEPIRGERTINEAEAEIIRPVFREFAAGISPRAIARRLNDEGVPGPNGTLWTDSTLRGHAGRGTGIINNELYVGRMVWNRLRYVKDPATGKRVSRINPREKWITTEVFELRIVDDDLASGERPPGRACGQIRQRHHRHPRSANQPVEWHAPAAFASLRLAGLRLPRWSLCLARPGSLCLFQPWHDRKLQQQPQHYPQGDELEPFIHLVTLLPGHFCSPRKRPGV